MPVPEVVVDTLRLGREEVDVRTVGSLEPAPLKKGFRVGDVEGEGEYAGQGVLAPDPGCEMVPRLGGARPRESA